MELTGKTLVFTDCHFGIRNNSIARLNILISVFKSIIKTLLLLPNNTFCILFYKEKPNRSFTRTIKEPYSCFYSITKFNSVTKPFYTKEYNDILYEVDIYKTQFLDRMLINAN